MKRASSGSRGRSGPRRALALSLVAMLVLAGACDGDGPLDPESRVVSVAITTIPPVLETGSTLQLVLDVRDLDGNPVDVGTLVPEFSTDEPSVATVSAAGLVTSVGRGEARITVEIGRASDTVLVVVIPEISSLAFLDSELKLVTRETQIPGLEVLDAQGEPVVDPVLEFWSSDAEVVSVHEAGRLLARSAGRVTISVVGGGETATLDVEVFADASGSLSLLGNAFLLEAGDAFDFAGRRPTVFVRVDGQPATDARLEFATTDAAVATVGSDGVLLAHAPGLAFLTVTSPDVAGSATFKLRVVDAGTIDGFDLVFEGGVSENTMRLGGDGDHLSLFFRITGAGAFYTDFLPSLSSSDEAVAVVSHSMDPIEDTVVGLVQAVAPGTATITAVAGGVTAQAVVTVLGP